ncbi:hypothetical protein [Mesorhizobium neociceri]|uniref:DUF4189 domain-containing protein n=1 Tax=Mesorhizobium neociceri TaxID=1307853 RepID=A0A838B7L3_9HYPH|nr:hypothetical protein [Mesorhizobium neociceri]MBA1142067.1 hypothetical protein [Mesorhizobium neociceri]
MKPTYITRVAASLLAGLFLVTAPSVGSAESLAGSKGDVRFWPKLRTNPKDPCTKAYNAYVAAGGHSAYATTPYMRVTYLYMICGSRINAPSQKAAEDTALRSCQAGRSKWKVTTGGACEIAASK